MEKRPPRGGRLKIMRVSLKKDLNGTADAAETDNLKKDIGWL